MANAQVLEQKQKIVSELAEKMKNAVAGVIVDYKGINVEDDTKLRAELRKAGVENSVVKTPSPQEPATKSDTVNSRKS